MKAKTEELLYWLLWSFGSVMQPTFRNLNASFEEWAYREGLLRQLAELQRQKMLESKTLSKRDRVYRLSAAGRVRALGGRDPEKQWSRRWDGRWRMVLFDVPTIHNSHRARIRRYLRGAGFGYLQNSVWITPDPLDRECQILRKGKIDVESLILLEAQPCSGESNEEMVAGAWDFDRINRQYAHCLTVLGEPLPATLETKSSARFLLDWGKREHEAWSKAMQSDPLLPRSLLPRRYLGCKAWKKRNQALRNMGKLLRSFRDEN